MVNVGTWGRGDVSRALTVLCLISAGCEARDEVGRPERASLPLELADTVCNAPAPPVLFALAVEGTPGFVDVGRGDRIGLRLESAAETDGIATVRAFVSTDGDRHSAEVLRADVAAGSAVEHDVSLDVFDLPADGRGHLTLSGRLELPDARVESSHAVLLMFQSTGGGWILFDETGRGELARGGALASGERDAELLARLPAAQRADGVSPVFMERMDADRPPADGPPDPDGEQAP